LKNFEADFYHFFLTLDDTTAILLLQFYKFCDLASVEGDSIYITTLFLSINGSHLSAKPFLYNILTFILNTVLPNLGFFSAL